MPDNWQDPVDHSRTARRFTGEALKNSHTVPGLLASGLGIFALVCALNLLALGHIGAGILAVLVAVVAGAAGMLWVLAQHRRVVRHELAWLAEHPDVKYEPPTG
ncbi:MAG: hypothetical protein KIH64_008915 [Mycobacterium sp.]|nr:hypothetical protein [Mycobacterium sp.]